MLTPVVVIPYDDHVKVLGRTTPKFLVAKQELYAMLQTWYERDIDVPSGVVALIGRELGINLSGTTMRDAFVLRERSGYIYDVASWELNLLCNYHCPHCYLSERPNRSMSMEQRRVVIARMVELGVMKLQITGGEPLIVRQYRQAQASPSIYCREASSRGGE